MASEQCSHHSYPELHNFSVGHSMSLWMHQRIVRMEVKNPCFTKISLLRIKYFVSSFGNLPRLLFYGILELQSGELLWFIFSYFFFFPAHLEKDPSNCLKLYFWPQAKKNAFLNNFPHLSFLSWIFKQMPLFLLWY